MEYKISHYPLENFSLYIKQIASPDYEGMTTKALKEFQNHIEKSLSKESKQKKESSFFVDKKI